MVQKKMRIIEFERRKQGMSQMSLALESGVDASYICRAERYGVVYDGHLDRIAKALNWNDDPNVLLKEVE